MLLIVAIFATITLLGIAAQFLGVDSRPGFQDPRQVEASYPNL